MLNRIDATDHQTLLGRGLEGFHAELLRPSGAKPSPVQNALVSLAVQLKEWLAVMDARFVAGSNLGARNSLVHLVWSNSLVRTLRELGLKDAGDCEMMDRASPAAILRSMQSRRVP